MKQQFSLINMEEEKYKIKVKNFKWEEILKNIDSNLYERIVEEIFDNSTLFYYTSARPETKKYINNLNQKQSKLAKQFLASLLKNPENFLEDNINYNVILKFIEGIEGELEDDEQRKEKILDFIEPYEISLKKSEDYNKIKNSILSKMSKESRNGIFAEILFYKTIDFLLNNSNLLFSKLSSITAGGTYAHGADGIFVNVSDNKIIFGFGEAKFCKDIDNAIQQIKNSISSIERLGNDIGFMSRNLSNMKHFSNELEEMNLEISDTIDALILKNINIEYIEKEIYIFMLYGGEDYYLKEKILKKLDSKNINVDGFNIKIICFPIINKNRLITKIMEKVDEIIKE